MSSPETLRAGQWAILEAHWPGQPSQRIGLLLLDQTENKLRAKVRCDWSMGGGEPELWVDLAADLERMGSEVGAEQTLEWLESTASHTIRLGARQAVTFSDLEGVLEMLYMQHVIKGPAIETEQATGAAVSHTRTWRRALGTSGSLLALAANIALVAVRSVSHNTSQSPPIAAEMAQKGCAYDSPLLPLLSQALPTRILDITLPRQSSSSGRRRAAAIQYRQCQRLHLDIKPAPTVRPHQPRAALASPPSLPVATQVPASDVALSLPTPPDCRPRHRCIRALIAPFRAIARAMVRHENNPASNFQQDN